MEDRHRPGRPTCLSLLYQTSTLQAINFRAAFDSSSNLRFGAEDPAPTRSSLVKRLRNWDDQGAWQDFFDTYWKLIFAVAIKAGLCDAEAQDVVQETVAAMAKKMRQGGHDRAKSWLCLITRGASLIISAPGRCAGQKAGKCLEAHRSFANEHDWCRF